VEDNSALRARESCEDGQGNTILKKDGVASQAREFYEVGRGSAEDNGALRVRESCDVVRGDGMP
jgi:hypothetical protein